MSGADAVVTFRWDGDVWAFAVEDVVEMTERRAVTPVPGMGERMAGIVSWRGRSLPVVYPRRLKDGAKAPETRSRFLVVRAGAPFAVPVDEPGRVAFALPAEEGPADEAEDPAVRAIRRADGARIRVLDPGVLVGRAANGAPGERSDD